VVVSTEIAYIYMVERTNPMSEIIIADLKRPRTRNAKTSVREKRLRTSEGKIERVLSFDTNSATFFDDLTTVFEKNVKRARQENKRLFGSPDGVIGKQARSQNKRLVGAGSKTKK
jgi:hypothetical protein